MKIKIFPNTDNKVQRPNFKKLDTFTEIKQIPDMICACCGRKVLSIDKYVASITPLSKPLEYVMQRGRFNYLKNLLPESWNLLKHFIIKYPKTSLDEIVAKKADFTALKITIADAMDASSIPLNTPERTVLDKEISRTFFKILENGRSFMKEATLVLESLSPYKSILSGYEKEVFEILEEYAKKYPDKTLSQIIQETHDIHDTRAALFKEKISNSINERLENIKQIVKDSPEIVKNFEDVEKEIIDIIYQDFSVTTRIFKIKKIYNKILNKNKGACYFHQILNEINQLPESIYNADTFLSNAYKYKHTDIKIITNLFTKFISSEAWIQELSENGVNKIGNKIVLCNGCVKEKKDTPYPIFIKLHPEIIENIPKQMNIITDEIMKKNLIGNFRFYPLIIARKFKAISDEKININLMSYAEETKKDSQKNIESLEEKIRELEYDRNEKISILDKFPTLRRELIERINMLNSKISKIRNQIVIEHDLQQKIEEYFKENSTK